MENQSFSIPRLRLFILSRIINKISLITNRKWKIKVIGNVCKSMRVGILGVCTSAPLFCISLYPFLHETIKIGRPGANKYCHWPVVEIQAGIEE